MKRRRGAARWPLPTVGAAIAVCAACHREEAPAPRPATTEQPSTAVYTPPTAVHWPPAASTSVAATGAPSSSAAPSASTEVPAPPPHDVDPQNKKKPSLASDDLTTRARHLFEALKADDPKLGADFFFPRDPFLPLKDIAKPGKYWDQLFRIYENDIHELHRKHGDWSDAAFVSFELGSPPTWVKPGEEANKIGYYRTFNGKLRYSAKDKTRTIEVKTIISWDDGWYVTHLLPIKK